MANVAGVALFFKLGNVAWRKQRPIHFLVYAKIALPDSRYCAEDRVLDAGHWTLDAQLFHPQYHTFMAFWVACAWLWEGMAVDDEPKHDTWFIPLRACARSCSSCSRQLLFSLFRCFLPTTFFLSFVLLSSSLVSFSSFHIPSPPSPFHSSLHYSHSSSHEDPPRARATESRQTIPIESCSTTRLHRLRSSRHGNSNSSTSTRPTKAPLLRQRPVVSTTITSTRPEDSLRLPLVPALRTCSTARPKASLRRLWISPPSPSTVLSTTTVSRWTKPLRGAKGKIIQEIL